MRLIVGLGNPGPRYADTPHNAGFVVCDRFAAKHRLPAEVAKFQGLFTRGKVLGHDVGVLKPQTYMNLSGESWSPRAICRSSRRTCWWSSTRWTS
jgi:PTH1 family peptidyl-tRNA hydrolase